MSFPKHTEYKESGAEWLGKVPAHWAVPPCRAIVIERSDRNEKGDCEDYLSLMANIGVIPYADKGDVGNKKPEDLSKCKMVHEGDFVINSMNYYIGSYGISPYHGVCSPVYIVLTPRNEVVDSRFAFRIFEDNRFQEYAQSFGNGILEHRRSINWDILKTIPVPVPPPDEQKAISSFLDVETSKIDGLVSEQRRLIELLKEKRQAVISHAVTKGLNPNAPMKPSGIQWLGDVPQHWSVKRLKYVVELIDGDRSSEYPSEGDLVDEGVPFLSSKNIVGFKFCDTGLRFITPEKFDALSRGKIVHNDLAITVRGTIGHVGIFDTLQFGHETAFINAQMMIMRPTNICPMFLHAVTESHLWQKQLDVASYGTAQQQLSNSVLSDVMLAVPPDNEIKEIVGYLHERLLAFDTLQAEAERAIELLQERRTALISAAVTGKIDVREFAN